VLPPSPTRHATAASLTSHVPPVQRASGGAGRGAVTPPPGAAARGRAVFVKLQCFTCHAVRGERFLAPSRPGPDLTGVGSRQAGYLLESVLNPNALIVDGPGYVDANGLSTMPDYCDRLTVAELIDLVAYSKGLDGAAGTRRETGQAREKVSHLLRGRQAESSVRVHEGEPTSTTSSEARPRPRQALALSLALKRGRRAPTCEARRAVESSGCHRVAGRRSRPSAATSRSPLSTTASATAKPARVSCSTSCDRARDDADAHRAR